ncbi:MAG: hypothetical protein OHK93_000916 [Ramalina farinacea]|uniref:Uncharacterized protein n=1 Tax=Ramalina farinacea TaxID=258253 RepID=A0AA43QNI0_9LECA|nr:hypothetical protein [Ramalina farinacea]
MPSRSNPNTPTSSKRKTLSVLKRNRRKTQRHRVAKSSGTAAPRTSQALRQARPLSGKKARKVEKKRGYDARRVLEEEGKRGEVEGEVEMRDVKVKVGKGGKEGGGKWDGEGGEWIWRRRGEGMGGGAMAYL